ncbi:mCG145900, partial [Mus musculus]
VPLPKLPTVGLQRRCPVKRPSICPVPLPEPSFCVMPPRGGGPLPSRSRIIPPPTIPRGPPGPRSLRLISLRSSPPPLVSRSLAALVFFSSTFKRTSPRNIIGFKTEK